MPRKILLFAAFAMLLASQPPSFAATGSVRLVKDVLPGPDGSNPTAVTVLDGAMYFVADDGIHGFELWRSDGTRGGTSLVKDIWPGPEDAFEIDLWFWSCDLARVGDTLYFAASSPDGQGLWRSDGTELGTVLVSQIRAECLTPVGDDVFFESWDETHGWELWKSDGTSDGTAMVKDIAHAARSSYPGQLTPLGEELYFTARDRHGWELWKSDGTEIGTVMVRDIDRRRSSRPDYLTPVGDSLFFTANDGIHGREPWTSDGTRRGTALVRDIDPGKDSSYPSYLTDVAGTAFFWAGIARRVGDSIVWRRFLWKSDGTEEGTARVSPVGVGTWDPDQYWTYPGTVAAVGEDLYFTFQDAIHGLELWKSDGTRRGTRIVSDIAEGRRDAVPYWLTDVGGTLYFFAFPRGPRGRAPLWRTDGTPDGTVIVEDAFPAPSRVDSPPPGWITELSGSIYITAARHARGYELWALGS
jgi:ELWxxDGT repeat protein